MSKEKNLPSQTAKPTWTAPVIEVLDMKLARNNVRATLVDSQSRS